jgi:2-haloacid dehalogenase
MKSYRGFLLDADNTLLDYDRAEQEALDETIAEAAPAVPRETARAVYREINQGYWRRFEEGTVTAADLKVGRFADFLKALGLDGDPRAVADRYLGRLGSKAYPLPHADEVVRRLSAGAAVALVTNGLTDVQRGRVRRSGWASCFRAVLISEEMGIAKPDPRFFAAALEALDLPADQVLCVGDNPVSDIGGAQAAGIDACWYAPSGAAWTGPAPAPRLVIRSLLELTGLLPPVFDG